MMAQASSESVFIAGEEIVQHARGWLGTPYRHQSSCKGAGTDCLGLIRGIWRELLGPEPELVPPYTPDWSETGRTEDLLQAASRHFELIQPINAVPGDVVVMRMREDCVAKHAGILAVSELSHPTIIHAYSGHGVVESALTPAWSRKIAGYFRFPDWRN